MTDAVSPAQSAKQLIEEMHDLLTILREMNGDGRRLALMLSESILGVANEQCGALDLRINQMESRIEEIVQKLAA
jgi:hypothetical protein